MSISLIDPGFYISIVHKYNRIRQPRLGFPSLLLLYSLPNSILPYQVLKNINILSERRNYHLNQHLKFFINLILRISPPGSSHSVPGMIIKTKFINEINRLTLPLLSQPETTDSHRDFFFLMMKNKLPGVELPQLKQPDFSHPALRFPGFLNSATIFREFKSGINKRQSQPHPVVENWESIPGKLINSHGYYRYQEFSYDSKTSNMIINAYKKLFKKKFLASNMNHIFPSGKYILSRLVANDAIYTRIIGLSSREPGALPERSETSKIFTDAYKLNLWKINNISRMNRLINMSHNMIIGFQDLVLKTDLPGREEKMVQTFWPVPSPNGKKTAAFYRTALSQLDTFNIKNITGEPGAGTTRVFSTRYSDIKELTERKTAVDTQRFFTGKNTADLHYFNPVHKTVSDIKSSSNLVGKNPDESRDLKGIATPFMKPTGLNLPGTRDPASQKPLVDVDQLTDQVYRMLERKIRVEKERRGW